jgi:hypothetical protein
VAEEAPAAEEVPAADEAPAVEEPLVAEEAPVPERGSLAAEESTREELAAEALPIPDSTEVRDQVIRPAREGSIDPAEMRRRIEETRARLKAKAFDAMMSGEAALLSRDAGESAVPREPEADVGDDVAQSIEDGLSEDDG